MNLYIDKENISSLINGRKNKLYNDCVKTIQKQLSVFFNFYKKELREDENLLAWFQNLTEGVGESNSFIFLDDTTFPKRPLSADSYLFFSSKQLSSVYLINDPNINALKNEGSVIVGGPGEEFEIFNMLFLMRGDYDFHRSFKIGGVEFNKWSDIKKYSLPLTDIIFVDPYILADVSRISSNLINYLKVLAGDAKCCINIVIYVKSGEIAIKFSALKKLIKDGILELTGIEPNFTLIKYTYIKDVKSLAEHDRTIFTNYFRINSGDTFNYFDSNDKVITNGREVNYSSFGKKENHILADLLLTDLQKNIEFLNDNNPNFIEGDKKSNFLKFK